ncbi:Uncharacterised protein [Jonesia denitrificans]|nr:Uncharacterised protein [Jonesia denitrificans]
MRIREEQYKTAPDCTCSQGLSYIAWRRIGDSNHQLHQGIFLLHFLAFTCINIALGVHQFASRIVGFAVQSGE